MKKTMLLFFGLGLFLYQTANHATPNNPYLEDQIPESQLSKPLSKESANKSLSSLESSLLSLKAEAGIGIVYAFFPLLLEFQTPVLRNNKKLKWLLQAGAGGTIAPFTKSGYFIYFPIDTGLRYNFQPLTVSLKGGSYIILQSGIEVAVTASLSVGWNITDSVHVELSGGSSDIRFLDSFFMSLAASIPIQRW